MSETVFTQNELACIVVALTTMQQLQGRLDAPDVYSAYIKAVGLLTSLGVDEKALPRLIDNVLGESALGKSHLM